MPTPTPVAGGQVTLTATDEVWMRVYDATGTTLYQNTLKPGDRYDVPADANNPMINIGRPDKLQVMLNGSLVAPLGDGKVAIKDVPIGAAALQARANGTPLPTTSATPAPTTTGTGPATTDPDTRRRGRRRVRSVRRRPHRARRRRPRPFRLPSRRRLPQPRHLGGWRQDDRVSYTRTFTGTGGCICVSL